MPRSATTALSASEPATPSASDRSGSTPAKHSRVAERSRARGPARSWMRSSARCGPRAGADARLPRSRNALCRPGSAAMITSFWPRGSPTASRHASVDRGARRHRPDVLDRPAGQKSFGCRASSRRGLVVGREGRRGRRLPLFAVWFVIVVEVRGRRGRRRRGAVGGRRSVSCASVTKASRLSATSVGESIGRMNSHTAARSAFSPPGRASRSLRRHSVCAERLGAGDAGGVEHERGSPAGGQLGDASQRVAVRERAL